MNHFHGARGRHRQIAGEPLDTGRARGAAAFDGVGRGERQRWTEPLAAGKKAVAHRLADDSRTDGRTRQMALERLVNPGARLFEKGGE